MNQKVEFIESYIKHGNGDYQWSDNHGELIRCKDCEHGEKCWPPHDEDYWCNAYEFYQTGNWFCADGERKEGR